MKAFRELEWLDVPAKWSFIDTQLIVYGINQVHMPRGHGMAKKIDDFKVPLDRGEQRAVE